MTSTAGDCAVMMFQFSLSAAWYKDHNISRFTRVSGEEQRDPAERSLAKRRQESKPALISVILPFLRRLSELKYHWTKRERRENRQSTMFAIKCPWSPAVTFRTIKKKVRVLLIYFFY